MSTLFSGHYVRNRSTLDIGVLGYIGIVQHKEHSPEVWSIPPVTPVYIYIYMYVYIYIYIYIADHKEIIFFCRSQDLPTLSLVGIPTALLRSVQTLNERFINQLYTVAV